MGLNVKVLFMGCGSVQHIAHVEKALGLKELIGDSFEQLSDIDKTVYVLGSELWEENFEEMLGLVKEFIIDVWEARKQNSMVRMHALVITSVRPWLEMQGLSLGVGGSGLVRWVSCRIRVSWVRVMYTVAMCMLVIVAPPIVVGALSMAFLLRQHV